MMKEKHSDISFAHNGYINRRQIIGTNTGTAKSKISSFTADYTKTLIIPSAYTNFTIRFASLTYNQPQLNKYAYRLQGFDTDWHYVNAANRNAYYSQLPAGEYVFELRATNENGDWGRNADNGNPYRTSFLGYLVGISYLRFTNCIFFRIDMVGNTPKTYVA